jgi:hypothetical protein
VHVLDAALGRGVSPSSSTIVDRRMVIVVVGYYYVDVTAMPDIGAILKQ